MDKEKIWDYGLLFFVVLKMIGAFIFFGYVMSFNTCDYYVVAGIALTIGLIELAVFTLYMKLMSIEDKLTERSG